MTNVRNNGVPENRDPDSVDYEKIIPTALYVFDSGLGRMVPVRSGQLGGGGSATDPDSARETTAQQMLAALLALGGNTDGLEALLAGTLKVSAQSLPLPAGAATDAKLEAVRALLAGTLTTQPATVSPGTVNGNLAAGSSQGAEANLGGLSVVRLNVDNWNTAADLTFETSPDGVTWRPLYDAYGNLVQYKVSGSRAVNVPVGDLLRLTRVRARSGAPGAYVAQGAAVTLSYTTAVL